jgi:hypothetical protein
VKTIRNAILEIFFFTGGFLPGLIKGLPGIAECENHYKCNLRKLNFYWCTVFLPGLNGCLGSLTVKTITNAILDI